MVVPLSSYEEIATALSIGEIDYSSEYISEEDYNLLLAVTDFTNNDWQNSGLEDINHGRLGGSSMAAPHVSATAALMLEASGDNIFDSTGLGWRDVQEIFAISSRHTGSDLDATVLHTDPIFQDEHFFGMSMARIILTAVVFILILIMVLACLMFMVQYALQKHGSFSILLETL
ncbi:MAG: hypothetical protein JKY84_01840 [Emcibacteraceae bacterium]|nr:hypothetical protein [Emcibacteraceae bacterium]